MHVHTHTEAFNLIQNKMRAGGWIIIHRICNRRTEELVELRDISDFSQHLEFPVERHKKEEIESTNVSKIYIINIQKKMRSLNIHL